MCLFLLALLLIKMTSGQTAGYRQKLLQIVFIYLCSIALYSVTYYAVFTKLRAEKKRGRTNNFRTLPSPRTYSNNRSPPQSPNGSTDTRLPEPFRLTVKSGQLSLLFNCETSKKLRLEWKVTNSILNCE